MIPFQIKIDFFPDEMNNNVNNILLDYIMVDQVFNLFFKIINFLFKLPFILFEDLNNLFEL